MVWTFLVNLPVLWGVAQRCGVCSGMIGGLPPPGGANCKNVEFS